jgi:hypothetical protein
MSNKGHKPVASHTREEKKAVSTRRSRPRSSIRPRRCATTDEEKQCRSSLLKM